VLITLMTTGRSSGQPREAQLYAFEDGADGDLVITGSWAGAARDPAWVLNLRAHPEAQVRRGRTTQTRVRAREATGSTRERLWRLVTEGFPMYRTYQRKTSRRFPIFVLEPDGRPDVR
jgi:deazaflavin-dependent oxidoreductase (nitroreductase family)